MNSKFMDAGDTGQSLCANFHDLSIGATGNEEINIASPLPEKRKIGDCYIFNYQKFLDDPDSTRHGSDKDVVRLENAFNGLNFNVYSGDDFSNLTAKRTLNALRTAGKKVHRDSKYFVCCILTHGNEGILSMHDTDIEIDDILKCFTREACDSLAGKQKIFIIQACRGGCHERSVPIVSNNSHNQGTKLSSSKKDLGEPLNQVKEFPIDLFDSDSKKDNPDYLDFLIAYSTYEGNAAYRTIKGTVFINALCCTIEKYKDKLDLIQILTITNYQVPCILEKSYRTQMPCFISRLRTEVKFYEEIVDLKSAEEPLIYNIENRTRIKFLFLINKKNNFQEVLSTSSTNLYLSLMKKKYKREDKYDWSRKVLRDYLEKVAVQDFSSTDCLILFIACRGKVDELFDVDGVRITKKEIVEQFTGESCPRLVGKPKIFIFLMSTPDSAAERKTSADDERVSTIPVHADILEVVFTVQESEQLKAVIEKCRDIFIEESSEDFLSQLTRMFLELEKNHGFYSPSKNYLPTFCFSSTLRKKLILNKK